MLARVNRIVDGEQLRRVSRHGVKFRSSIVMASRVSTESDSPARFGFIVSKQVGGAVTRNLVKRRLRALAAHTLAENPVGYDVVVRAQAGSSTASFEVLAREWEQLVAHLVESR
ncbi:MAG: ribonuclease P protein component [Actinobacteria bacterium]|nr:ribonuclease P protein component [Actinomycetota bacterium]